MTKKVPRVAARRSGHPDEFAVPAERHDDAQHRRAGLRRGIIALVILYLVFTRAHAKSDAPHADAIPEPARR
ncbi:hypothetical protein [Mycobacterium sp. E342]|uniref:hypothetical protein n=1 Tax=Mycobacterium sp. E342 TaxID=1834147 RepID=UPI000AAC017B|nr:hypothetical protein [Mycobacterium sp. E342]